MQNTLVNLLGAVFQQGEKGRTQGLLLLYCATARTKPHLTHSIQVSLSRHRTHTHPGGTRVIAWLHILSGDGSGSYQRGSSFRKETEKNSTIAKTSWTEWTQYSWVNNSRRSHGECDSHQPSPFKGSISYSLERIDGIQRTPIEPLHNKWYHRTLRLRISFLWKF